MNTGPFRGPALVAGSIKGVRHFNVTHEPALIGPASNSPFMPGENVAEHGFNTTLVPVYGANNSGVPRVFGFNAGKRLAQLEVEEDHVVAGRNCMCGFYGYYDLGFSEYAHGARVAAVIEGYGHVTVGTRGFRAEKARLVAVTAPPDLLAERQKYDFVDHQWEGHLRRFNENYPDVPVYEDAREMLEAHPLDPAPEEAPEDNITTVTWGTLVIPAQMLATLGQQVQPPPPPTPTPKVLPPPAPDPLANIRDPSVVGGLLMVIVAGVRGLWRKFRSWFE